jgi:arylsulfatase A-like enzyme
MKKTFRIVFIAALLVMGLTVGYALFKTAGGVRLRENLSRRLAGNVQSPNVIWIVFDAMRADHLSCYGYDRPTSPNLDRFARAGALFESNHPQGFTTVHSVPSYLTGRYFPVKCIGYLPCDLMMKTPPANEHLISDMMKSNGYETVLVAAHAWISEETRLWRSFDKPVFVQPDVKQERHAMFDKVSKTVLDEIDRRDVRKPLFMYVHAMDTHTPHTPRPPHDRWLPQGMREPKPPYSDEDQNYLRGLYDGSISYADEQFGRFVEELSKRKMLDNTIIVVSADHGEIVGEDGETFAHHSVPCAEILNTPLVMAGPGIPKGIRPKQITENVDIVATLVDLLRLKTDADLDGKSLKPLLEHPDGPPLRMFSMACRKNAKGKEGLVLQSKEYMYSVAQTQLYKMPCHLTKEEVFADADGKVKAAFDAYIEQTLLPKIMAYDALPLTTPAVFYMRVPEQVSPPEACVPEEEDASKDNKWGRIQNMLRAWPTETVPPISFKMEMPNGTYRVMMELSSGILNEGPQCVVGYQVNGEPVWRAVSSPFLDKESSFRFVDIGEYAVKDKIFNISLRQALPGTAVVVRQFRFQPVLLETSETGQSSESISAKTEQLRALGYLE